MREPSRLSDTAAMIEGRINALEEAKSAARTRAERRPINQQLHAAQSLLAWIETRKGYTDGEG
jgi:hypothetical protein